MEWSKGNLTQTSTKKVLGLTSPPMLVCDFIKSRGFSLKNLLSNFSIIRERNPFSDSRVRSNEQSLCVPSQNSKDKGANFANMST